MGQEHIVKSLSACFAALLLNACSSGMPPDMGGPKVTHGDQGLENNCSVTQELKITQGEESHILKKFIGFDQDCANYDLMALILKHELNNPDMEAITTTAVLIMISEQDDKVRSAILKALAKRDVTEDDLKERVRRDAAIIAVKSTPETDCIKFKEDEYICD